MKKIIKFIFGTVLSSFFIVTFLLSSFVGFSQTTPIPDPNFERKLITLGYDSGDIDGFVLTANISSITSLDISNNFSTPNSDKISDLIGIEAFTALTWLACGFNQLTSLDVSANTALTLLWCNFNQLTTLDVSANTALTLLWCGNNQLTSLNVANGNNSNFNFTLDGDKRVDYSFNVSNNPNLTCIQVDDVSYIQHIGPTRMQLLFIAKIVQLQATRI